MITFFIAAGFLVRDKSVTHTRTDLGLFSPVRYLMTLVTGSI
jgi:hypothetical protein